MTAVSVVLIENEEKANAALPEKNYTSLVLKVANYYGLNTPGFEDGDSTVATFNSPRSLCTDNQGAIFVADTNNNAIRLINDSVVSTIITYTNDGSLDRPSGIAYVNSSLVVFSDTMHNMIYGFNPSDPLYYPYFSLGKKQGGFDDGDFSIATFKNPQGLVVANGDLFVADTNNSVVRKIDFINGRVSTVSTGYSSGSSLSKRDLSGFSTPTQLAVDKNGIIYVVDSGNYAGNILDNFSCQDFT